MFIVLKNIQGLRREGYKSGILSAVLNEEKKHLFGTGGVDRMSRFLESLEGLNRFVMHLGLLLNSLCVQFVGHHVICVVFLYMKHFSNFSK